MFDSAQPNRLVSAARIVAAVVLTASFVIAGGATVSAQTPNKKALIGSWLETVTFPPESGRPPIKSLGSFHRDGTMICSDQGAVTTTEPPSVFTSCHGVWTHLNERQFAYTSLALISDFSGNLAGYLKVRGIYTVGQSGDEYSGTSFAEILDPAGVVLFSVGVTNAGKRIRVELP